MRMSFRPPALFLVGVFLLLVAAPEGEARNPIRSSFFTEYPSANGTQLDQLPSDAKHCGVCHFDFGGGGPRNPYGLAVEIGLGSGLSDNQAIQAIHNDDSDNDGYPNSVEILSTLFSNTPTFPGLTEGNKTNTSNIPVGEIEPYLTPAGGSDTIPPVVTVLSPNGGGSNQAGSFTSVTYTATDASGILFIDVYLSDDGGSNYKFVGKNEPHTGSFSWFVPNRPGGSNRIKVVAIDSVGNSGEDASDADFTINGQPAGIVPSTLRDMDLAGTQPFEGAILDNPEGCMTCHGGYDDAVEPWFNWFGSMMGQAMRDPLFLACMAVAEQDAPSVGDLCLRCHTPGGWQEGRSVDTDGDLLVEKDIHGIHCDYCHRMVDYDYTPGISPPEDSPVLANIDPLPLQYGNGQFISDPAPLLRGPFSDANASHQFLESPFHRSANICGTCHDVSNPVFEKSGDRYVPTAFDAEHPDMDTRNMFPVERTFSEWSQSEYASTGVYAPQFAGDKPNGIVSTCQDCHMRDVTGTGCNEPGAPTRTNLPLHDMTGGNTLLPGIIAQFYPDDVDTAALTAAAARAVTMLQLAATLAITPEDFGATVRVTNETGHKLPSGYPEGRRIWLNVVAYDNLGAPVFESGAYNYSTGELAHDSQAKIYETHPGLSPGLATALGLASGPSFHFVLSDTVWEDNRIPPRGFTNAGFEAIQSPPVGYTYADGQYWDDTEYQLPANAESVSVTLLYQTTTKEYVEFLRDENVTNSAGIDFYNAWVTAGRGAPVIMAQAGAAIDVVATDVEEAAGQPARFQYALNQGQPNPFRGNTTIAYSLGGNERVTIGVYEPSGRLVRNLVNRVQPANRYVVTWDGRDERGREVASGMYLIRYQAGDHSFTKRSVLLK